MALEKAGNCIPTILANILQYNITKVKENEIPCFYRENLREGMQNLKGNLRKNFKDYLLGLKDKKLEIIVREMENDERQAINNALTSVYNS